MTARRLCIDELFITPEGPRSSGPSSAARCAIHARYNDVGFAWASNAAPCTARRAGRVPVARRHRGYVHHRAVAADRTHARRVRADRALRAHGTRTSRSSPSSACAPCAMAFRGIASTRRQVCGTSAGPTARSSGCWSSASSRSSTSCTTGCRRGSTVPTRIRIIPEFVAEYAARIAERFRGRIHTYTPLNEPRVTAWYCGKLGWWPPGRRGWRGFGA